MSKIRVLRADDHSLLREEPDLEKEFPQVPVLVLSRDRLPLAHAVPPATTGQEAGVVYEQQAGNEGK